MCRWTGPLMDSVRHATVTLMEGRVLVAGEPLVVEAVCRALPEMKVLAAPAVLDIAELREADCLLIGPETEMSPEHWEIQARNIPVVKLAPTGSESIPAPAWDAIPSARIESSSELRLALRVALLQHRVRQFSAELAGPWLHDARGAVGVARLALELLKSGSDPASAVQKMDNGVTRLGWLIERLPSQMALAVDLPLTERVSASLFPNLEAYVNHLQLIHSRRPIESDAGKWLASADSQALVPFAAGFAELALKVSSARAKVRFSMPAADALQVECECPTRPEPWNVHETLSAFQLSRRDDSFAPYRLVEAARLALRTDATLSVEFTEHGFLARVALGERT